MELLNICYGKLSKSEAHQNAVKALYNKEIRGWESTYKRLLGTNPDMALEYAIKRPGFFVRNITEMISNGADVTKAQKLISENAEGIPLRVLVDLAGIMNPAIMPIRRSEEDTAAYNARVEDPKFKLVREASYLLSMSAMAEKMKSQETPFRDKKVYFDAENVNLEHSLVDTMGMADGEYVRSGLAYNIPEDVNIVRFFVYWNNSTSRVDIDLHGAGITRDGRVLHVGWNGSFRNNSVYYSGDMTCNDSTEFIDVDLNRTYLSKIALNINSFTEQSFKDIDTVNAGITAVERINDSVAVYTPTNTIFMQDIKRDMTNTLYATLDVDNRVLRLATNKMQGGSYRDISILNGNRDYAISMKDYLDAYFKAQNVTIVETPDEAEVIITMSKNDYENGYSLIEGNYFLD